MIKKYRPFKTVWPSAVAKHNGLKHRFRSKNLIFHIRLKFLSILILLFNI